MKSLVLSNKSILAKIVMIFQPYPTQIKFWKEKKGRK